MLNDRALPTILWRHPVSIYTWFRILVAPALSQNPTCKTFRSILISGKQSKIFALRNVALIGTDLDPVFLHGLCTQDVLVSVGAANLFMPDFLNFQSQIYVSEKLWGGGGRVNDRSFSH